MPAAMIQLDAVEARVLGSLVEKSRTTPDQYPLTFNALVSACNQKTSRDPVMELDADSVGRAIRTLDERGLLDRLTVPGSRVPKFRHRIEKLLGSDEPKLVGTVCVLLLRGPQTPGEIKGRTDRLCEFESTAEAEALLQDLCSRPEGAFAARLPRQPGQKEARYQHLFSGAPPAVEPAASTAAASAPAALEKRVEALEARVRALEAMLRETVPSKG